MKTGLAVSAVMLALLTLPAAAHHNAFLLFDMEKTETIKGVVTRFNPGNPHSRIFFTRIDGVGKPDQEWMAEGGSRTILLRRDWTPGLVKPGDAITIIGNPARDSSNMTHMIWVTLPSGRKLWAEDFPPPPGAN